MADDIHPTLMESNDAANKAVADAAAKSERERIAAAGGAKQATPAYVPPANFTPPTDDVAKEKIRADAAQLEQDRLADHPPGSGVNTLTSTPGIDPKAPVTAATKLRAFEDRHFGRDVVRINGEIERGVGSRYAAMTQHQKAHYASLEHLVRSERAMADASADLELSKARHDVAVKTSDTAEKAIVTADAAATAEDKRLAAEGRTAQTRPGQPNLQTRQNLPGEVNWNTPAQTPSEPGHTGVATPPNNWPNQPNPPEKVV